MLLKIIVLVAMKKIIILSILFCLCLLSNAQENPQLRSRVVTDTIKSEILMAERPFTVYLPKSYEDGTQKEYPIMYLLHGMYGNNKSWFSDMKVQDVMDQLTASGEAVEMIIVSPHAGGYPKTEQNGYFNIPGWNYEDFFFQEFMPMIETKFRVKSDKGHRAIAGLSMGGGGATAYAQKHSELFGSVYAMSALMNIPDYSEDEIEKMDEKVVALGKSVMENSCIDFVEDSDNATKEELKTVKWFVDCGDDDFLLDRNIEFFNAMKKAGIPLQFRVRDGGHTSEYWHSALYESLPFASRNFEK